MSQQDRLNLLGYSERGMIWSLFAELTRHEDGIRHLGALVSQITGSSDDVAPVSATVLVEQSFSGFGNADVVVLLDFETRKRMLFIEAKVKRQQTWTIGAELDRFRRARDANQAVFSNLLVQLYAKQRLVEALVGSEDIDAGVEFRLRSFGRRKIGANRVVLNAVEKIRKYVHDTFYVALIPDATGFDAAVRGFETVNGITCSAWRVLSWAQVEAHCHNSKLSQTISAFEFNAGQIH
jgi:hypothetical protein